MDYSYKKKSGIYQISTLINDKVYIGSAVDLYGRYGLHKHELTHNKHSNIKLQRFVNKHGFDKLTFNVLELCPKNDLVKREQYYLDTTKSFFNTCKIAGNTLGYKMPREICERLANLKRGVPSKRMLGKKHSEQTKALIREKAIKRGLSKNFIIASIKANTGRKHSKEMRQRIAEKTRKISNEQTVEIRQLINNGMRQKDIAKLYNVSQRLICRVHLGFGIYFNGAVKRLEEHKKQIRMFEGIRK